jgi:hypothetical protein
LLESLILIIADKARARGQGSTKLS